MTTFIAILRGINVSGHRMIKMAALKELIKSIGFQNVKTYIQSGNLVFQSPNSDPGQLAETISKAIEKQFGFDVPVIGMDLEDLKRAAQQNPFLADETRDQSFFHITFLSESPENENLSKLDEFQNLPNEFRVIEKWVHLYCPNGYSNCKLTNEFLEKKLKVKATTRNWKTVLELIRLGETLENQPG